jgi:carbonic anhydrase/acetyltransferase-like protein (isoleucine patch superfamily)
MQNTDRLRLNVGVRGAQEARGWLEGQSEAVRRVTLADASGGLTQGPVVEPGAYVDPTARLIGGMIVGEGCYVGPFAVIRLDEKPDPEPLIIGRCTNIQDCAIVHSTTQRIGERVIVAHQAIVHGAVVEDDVSIYIQAVVDGGGTVIGRGSFIHQGAYVGKGLAIPPGSYVEPGRKVLTQAEADSLGPVPDALRKVREHVMELNAAHNARYLAGG